MNILQQKVTLNNGLKMPAFGLRTQGLKNAKKTVEYALQQGYRLFDSAQFYGNEKMLGQVIKSSGIPRSEIFFVSKLWINQCRYTTAQKTILKMLQNSQTNYLDLCLIHFPVPHRLEVWKTLEEAYRDDQVKAIGVSNFNIEQLKELQKTCSVAPHGQSNWIKFNLSPN